MSPTALYLILIFSLFIPPHPTIADQSFISLIVTQPGLDFVKDLLISKVISSLKPTGISELQSNVRIPVIGKVHIVLSDIKITRVDVGSSLVKPGPNGVSIVGSAITCDLDMKWHYSYGSWGVVPISISDSGTASVEVNGMETSLLLGLSYQQGTMKLSLVKCKCNILKLNINLYGGASWLYQGIVDAFEEDIASAVEKEIIKKLNKGVVKLGSILQSFPKEIHFDNTALLNTTFVDDPYLSENSLGFEINGLFNPTQTKTFPWKNALLQLVSCSNSSKMMGIEIDEAVFNSAAALYYNGPYMHWIVDKVPQQSLLNTAGWRYIIPQLYRKYPNCDMNLNISLSAPPVVRIAMERIEATVYSDFIIDVLQGDQTIPVACIALEIAGTGSIQVNGNNLTAHMKMDDFTMSLKWSKIGTLHMFLIQPVMWTIIETVFLPYANERLGEGYPLPIIHGFTLQNAEIIPSDSRITICSDVSYEESFNRSRSLVYAS